MHPLEAAVGQDPELPRPANSPRARLLLPLSVFCPSPVPECLSQAKEAERLHPACPQRYCAGTGSAPAGRAPRAVALPLLFQRERWGLGNGSLPTRSTAVEGSCLAIAGSTCWTIWRCLSANTHRLFSLTTESASSGNFFFFFFKSWYFY